MRKLSSKFIKRIAIATSVTVSLTLLISSTFAWYTAKDEKKNHFETYWEPGEDVPNLKIKEDVEEGNVVPGKNLNKDVWVINNGDAPALTRISFAEVLAKLENNGAVTWQDTIWDSTKTTSVPQAFSAAALDGAFKDWKEFSAANLSADGLTLTGEITVPENVLGRYLKEADSDGCDLTLVFYADLGEVNAKSKSRYQIVDFDFELGEYDSVLDKADFSFTEPFKFAVFTTTTTPVKVKWAELAAHAGIAGNIDPIDSTYTLQTLPDETVIDPTHLVIPAKSDAGKMIILTFSPDVITTLTGTAADAGKWWYNQADGYFYYIGKVDGGKQTSKLLDAYGLHGDANNSYSGLSYDLHVKMDGLENVKEALLASPSSGGWGIPATGWGETFMASLEAANAF